MTVALQDNALVDLAFAKSYIGGIKDSSTDQDDIVSFFINAASDYLEAECERRFKSQAYAGETHSGRSNNIILLKNYPVTSITEVRIDPTAQFTDPSTVVPSSAYTLSDDGNSLLKLNGVWPKGSSNIRVSYTAGFTSIPSDLQNAALWLVTWYYQMKANKDIGRVSKSKGDETTSILQSAPQEVRDCVERYERLEVALLGSPIINR